MPIKYTISNIKDTNSDIPNINVNMLIIDPKHMDLYCFATRQFRKPFWIDYVDFKIQHVE